MNDIYSFSDFYPKIFDNSSSAKLKEILERINTIYKTRKYKNLYTFVLSGLTIFLYIIMPFFVTRDIILFTRWLDLIIRICVAYSFCVSIYSISHLDECYERFYKGAKLPLFSAPDTFKQILNIFWAVFAGISGYLVYKFTMSFFIPNIGITGTIISIFIGIMAFIPLLSQYKKR